MQYKDMADDLLRFFEDHSIRQAALVGHSMGGKAVQSMALSKDLPADFLSYLISVDMSPARGPLSAEFAVSRCRPPLRQKGLKSLNSYHFSQRYIDGMLEIEEAKCSSRQQADDILQTIEPDLGIRQFLLTNLQKLPSAQHWTFRIPIRLIKKNIEQIGDFPYDDENGLLEDGREMSRWEGKTLFVKGAKSK
jgi:pimeloyl-ACP methyl ester carboxylesterase